MRKKNNQSKLQSWVIKMNIWIMYIVENIIHSYTEQMYRIMLWLFKNAYELVCIVQKSFNLLWCKKLYASITW